MTGKASAEVFGGPCPPSRSPGALGAAGTSRDEPWGAGTLLGRLRLSPIVTVTQSPALSPRASQVIGSTENERTAIKLNNGNRGGLQETAAAKPSGFHSVPSERKVLSAGCEHGGA